MGLPPLWRSRVASSSRSSPNDLASSATAACSRGRTGTSATWVWWGKAFSHVARGASGTNSAVRAMPITSTGDVASGPIRRPNTSKVSASTWANWSITSTGGSSSDRCFSRVPKAPNSALRLVVCRAPVSSIPIS